MEENYGDYGIRYKLYLNSEVWQKLRTQRLKIDGFKCQLCGSPLDLQVHHLNYPKELGTENVATDLITLCSSCHEQVEKAKKDFRSEMYRQIVAEEKKREAEMAERQEYYDKIRREQEENDRRHKRMRQLTVLFIIDNKENDYSKNGPFDFCNRDVVKAQLRPWLEEHGVEYEYDCYGIVSNYFRNRRYEVILSMIENGYDAAYIRKNTKFSDKMIKKVCDNPETARAALQNERKDISDYE